MREILFRGKRVNDIGEPKEWVEGYFVNASLYLDDSPCALIFPTDVTLYPHSELAGMVEVSPETVGQWTGLLDKNGKKIFEGDIVRDDYGYVRKVTFVNARFTPFNTYPEYTCWSDDECMIIGNIHDNPELLAN